MKLKNTFKLLFSNLKIVISDFLFRFAVTLILTAVTASFLIPFVKEIFSSAEGAELFGAFKGIIGAFFSAGSEFAESSERFSAAATAFFGMLGGKMGEITWVAVGIVAIIIVDAAFFGFANYASGVAVNSYMSSLSRIGYLSAILHGFGKCFLYQLISVSSFIVCNILFLAAGYGVFTLTAPVIYVLSLPLSLLIPVAGNAAYCAFFSCFLPSVTAGENGVIKGIKESFSIGAKKFGELFAQYVFMVLLVFYVNVSAAVFTLGVGFVFSLPATCVCISCLKFVNYYSFTGRKYYIDFDTVITPPKTKTDGEYFNGMDM
ncbi:MAG: hypothetical protein IJR61_00115 [Clostridia bacterium]|nr:hypothetical protein [Clostridia bacterium]